MNAQELLDESLKYVSERVRFWVVSSDGAMWLNVAQEYLHHEPKIATKHMVTFMIKTYNIKTTGVVR